MALQVTIDGKSGTIQQDGMVRFGSDSQMNVLFYNRVVHDPEKSRELGRPWSKAMDYVRIQQPGERDYVDRPASDQDKQRFPSHWAHYKKGKVKAPDGTPVDVLFPQHPEIAANLHGLGVHTIEQLANLTEHGADTIGMGSTMWREKARQFLNAAGSGAGLHKLQKQLDDERNKNEVLANQVALMKTQLDRLMAEVRQGIPPAAIPPMSTTLAQEAFRAPAMSFANDGEEEAESEENEDLDPYAADAPFQSAEPMFTEEPEQQPTPKRRGRPPGSRNLK